MVTQWTSTASPAPWIVVLVALRQLSLPYGNRAFLRRGRRCPYDLRSARLSQAKSSSFFTGQRREAVASRRASDYSLRNQLASPFPAPAILPQNAPCPVRAAVWDSPRKWVHSPPSSIGSVVPTVPAIMAPSPAASNNKSTPTAHAWAVTQFFDWPAARHISDGLTKSTPCSSPAYIWVVVICRWPKRLCTFRMSTPGSSSRTAVVARRGGGV